MQISESGIGEFRSYAKTKRTGENARPLLPENLAKARLEPPPLS